jgi:diaminohydroxyphosphoribosylaminopyrimidine deaminase/5-amino-6-(5-phosphoribosylamino)uracil reductase
MDSHDKVNGKGKKILMDAGIETLSGILENKCRELNKRFFTFHEKKRPFIILKWAESNDGFIDKDFKPTKISNELASQLVHQIRSEEHAILVGTQTALTDNPSLTTRLVEGRNPVRILIDFDLKVPQNFKIYNDEAPTLIFNQEKEADEGNIKFIKISKENFLEELMQKLFENQIQSVLVEGGSRTLQTFINANLWDETIIIKNENLILENGTKAPNFEGNLTEEKIFRDNKVSFYRNK